jgi:hypothetical protein
MPVVCSRCGTRHARFSLQGNPRCLRCAIRFRPMLRRSLLTALVVGTILTAINQGNLILQGNLSPILLWKIPLTYCVPFCVATWGALINSRLER